MSSEEALTDDQKMQCSVNGATATGARAKKRPLKPKRAMTAYNVFFKEERRKILAGEDPETANVVHAAKKRGSLSGLTCLKRGRVYKKCEPDINNYTNASTKRCDDSNDVILMNKTNVTDTKHKVLTSPQTLQADPNILTFDDLGRIIGKRWREITDEHLTKFIQLAEADSRRYKEEMKTFYEKEISAICHGCDDPSMSVTQDTSSLSTCREASSSTPSDSSSHFATHTSVARRNLNRNPEGTSFIEELARSSQERRRRQSECASFPRRFESYESDHLHQSNVIASAERFADATIVSPVCYLDNDAVVGQFLHQSLLANHLHGSVVSQSRPSPCNTSRITVVPSSTDVGRAFTTNLAAERYLQDSVLFNSGITTNNFSLPSDSSRLVDLSWMRFLSQQEDVPPNFENKYLDDGEVRDAQLQYEPNNKTVVTNKFVEPRRQWGSSQPQDRQHNLCPNVNHLGLSRQINVHFPTISHGREENTFATSNCLPYFGVQCAQPSESQIPNYDTDRYHRQLNNLRTEDTVSEGWKEAALPISTLEEEHSWSNDKSK